MKISMRTQKVTSVDVYILFYLVFVGAPPALTGVLGNTGAFVKPTWDNIFNLARDYDSPERPFRAGISGHPWFGK